MLTLGLLGYFGYGMFIKIQQKKEVAARIERVPDFSFKTLAGKDFTNTQLAGATTIFLYFNSECEYCQEEAKEIKKSLSKFKNVQLIFVSNETLEKIKFFSEHYKLSQYDNICFLHDSRNDFTLLFGAATIPYSLVYDGDQVLIATFKGFVKVENLLKVLP